MLTPGIRFGPYEIGEPIGSGGMGEVYRARDARLDRVVALKVLPTALGADSQALQRFEREAQAIAALNHPNICTIHDVGEAPDSSRTRFIVMELLEGETLRQRLSRGRLDPAALVDVAVALTSALDAAHKKGIVHRDIKPSNIMLTQANDVRIIDFGIALVADSDISRIEGIAGSPSYMSPEQVQSLEITNRSDLYSLGAVMYEMLTGFRPFRGGNLSKLLHQIVYATPPPIHTQRKDVPEELVTSEREIFAGTDEVLSKPEQAREKIVDGMLQKRFFAARSSRRLALAGRRSCSPHRTIR